jgi:hypothetical protein
MAESAREKLGVIAREQPSIRANLTDAEQLLAQAEEQIKSCNADKARQMLNDARLYYESLPTQAEAELLAYAIRADSEFRTDTAIAALNELLELNPANKDATRLLDQIQSKERPHDRIAILEGSWRVNGKALPNHPSKDDLERVLGKSRALSGQSGFVFDEFGILGIPDPETGKIMLMTVYYGSPQWEYEPHKAFPGLVEVEGIPIKHDSTMADLSASLARWKPEISQAQKTFQIKLDNFRIHVTYGETPNQIYTVSIGLIE